MNGTAEQFARLFAFALATWLALLSIGLSSDCVSPFRLNRPVYLDCLMFPAHRKAVLCSNLRGRRRALFLLHTLSAERQPRPPSRSLPT